MDKKTLLAFILIGVILLLTPKYQEWMIGSKGVPKVSPILSANQGSPSPKNPSGIAQLKSMELPLFPDSLSLLGGPEQEVILENDLFVSRWTTRGGILRSWVLKGFKDGSRLHPVELMGPGGVACVLTVGGDVLSNLIFHPSHDSITVRENQTAILSWTAQWKNSIIEKQIKIVGNRYDFDVEVFIHGPASDQKCGLEWHGGMGHSESPTTNEMAQTKIITFMGGVLENWNIDQAKSSRSRPSGEGGWIGLRNKYFLVAFLSERQGNYGMVLQGKDLDGIQSFNFGLVSDSEKGSWHGSLYGGPISYSILDQYYNGELHQTMSWGWEFARGLMEPIGVGILKIFLAIHDLVPNYGLVIILFSILVKIALYPLTHKSYEATGRMQEVQPQIAALREKYQNDQQRLNQEMMKLYKEQGINPLGGCLPVLFQMPILFALFNVFQNAIELRQAPFMGWINDLSQPEDLSVAGYPLHILPVLMAVTMFLQQRTTIKDPNQKMMVYLMPLMMIFFFWKMSSGLVLYWTMFNLLSWAQQIGIDLSRKR